jgi:hypothetical protein
MRILLCLIILFVTSCANEQKNEQGNETILDKGREIAGEVSTNVADTLCFIKTAGTTNQDTALIRLVIINDKVSGKMMNLPHETDSRIGRLSGKKEGDIVNCKWIYMQEGMIDSVLVSYKIEGDKLMQKASWIDPKTGRETLPDSSTYRILFDKADCPSVPMLEYDLSKIGL